MEEPMDCQCKVKYSVIVGLALILALLMFSIGRLVERSMPACHAPTEESTMVDCYYYDGAWWRK